MPLVKQHQFLKAESHDYGLVSEICSKMGCIKF